MDDPVPVLRLRGVTFGYPGRDPVLRGLDFRLDPGEREGVQGPNGSGKTTLFRVALGLVRPRQGAVEVDGRAVATRDDWARARRRVGLLFQDADDQLFCPTVLEDVAFGPRNLGCTAAEARRRAEETLASLGIGHLAGRVTHRLSGGEKKLSALASVLAMRPAALLLDEPVAGLDEEAAATVTRVLSGLPQALAVISHGRAFLDALGARTRVLRAGRLEEG